MSTVLFRADGSTRLGLGHIMRCLAFADALAKRHVIPVFAVRAFEPRVSELIRARGYEVEPIAPDASDEDDRQRVRAIVVRRGVRVIVTDVCHHWALAQRSRLEAYHRQIGEGGFVIALSGSDVVDLPCDVIVNPYVRTTYVQQPPGSKPARLLGPRYFIFRNEFSRAAETERTIAQKAKRVLITVGGADELRLTITIVKALQLLADAEVDARIVLGPAYPAGLGASVRELLAGAPGTYTLLEQVDDMAKQMLRADLAIIGDGLTKYEAAVTGTPSLMVSRPESEHALNQEFERAGTALHVGDGTAMSPQALAVHIQRLLQDAPLRKAMSARGKAMVDGCGLERILASLPAGVLE